MKCLHCQTENPQEAAFCVNCGKRLDGRCPQCGEPVTEGAAYCSTCGKSLSGCATRAKKYVNLAAHVCAILAALTSLLGVLTMGSALAVRQGTLQVVAQPSVTLYYYFGDAFRIDQTVSQPERVMLTSSALLGTFASTLAIASVVTLFVVTAVRAVKLLNGKEGAFAAGTATYFAFAGGAALFALCTANANTLITDTTRINVLDGNTTAALIIGLILTVVAIVLKVLAGNVRQEALRGGATLTFATLSAICCGLLSAGAGKFIDADGTTYNLGITYLHQTLSSSLTLEAQDVALANSVTAFSIITFVAMAAAVAFAVAAAYMLLADKKYAKVFGIVSCAAAIVSAVFTICTVTTARDALVTETGLYNLAAPIAVIVLEAIMLVALAIPMPKQSQTKADQAHAEVAQEE